MKRRFLGEEAGFTLPEMLVTITIMMSVLFALYSIFDMSVRVFRFGNDKVEAAQNARLGLEKMSREIRAAYPYNKGALTPDQHLFDSMGTTSITFGNDLGSGNRVINETTEEITYSLSASGPPYTLQRTVGTGTAQPVVEYVGKFDNGTPDPSDDTPGLKFEYLKRSGTDLVPVTPLDATTESQIQVVRITVVIDKSGRTQELTTDVYLRSRSQ
jgi:prepilin-type N-terminal cleavage/methylation domain-containing protein